MYGEDLKFGKTRNDGETFEKEESCKGLAASKKLVRNG